MSKNPMTVAIKRRWMKPARKSDEVYKAVQAEAERIAKGLGAGYIVERHKGKSRDTARIFPGDMATYRANQNKNTLVKGISEFGLKPGLGKKKSQTKKGKGS